ncbi:MAG: ATPase domain-containing protein [Candidatus Woesearchaeota archaeon]
MMESNELIFDYSLPDDELHKTLGGGLPKNGIVLVEGNPGKGKSILVQRFVYGLLQNNQTVSYISSELSVQGFLNQMSSLNYEIKNDFLTGKLRFVSLFSKNHDIDEKENLIENFFTSSELVKNEVVVFDMANHVLVDDSLSYEKCYTVASELKKHASQGKCVVVCVEKSSVNPNFYSVLANISDGHIEMTEKEQYGVVLSLIKVHRMACAVTSVEGEVPFKIRSGVGIVVDISS